MNQKDENLRILVGRMVMPPPDDARKDAALKNALAALVSQPLPVTVNRLQSFGEINQRTEHDKDQG